VKKKSIWAGTAVFASHGDADDEKTTEIYD